MEELNLQNKVLLITTKGCNACEIMTNLINEAAKSFKQEVDIIIKDIKEIDKTFLKQKKVKDFPTMFLIKKDTIMFKYEGTAPSVVILQWFKVYFNKR